MYQSNADNSAITVSESFKSKVKITEKIPAAGNTKGVEVAVLLQDLSKFWRTCEMPLINCEINVILTCSLTFVITYSTGPRIFAITDKKLDVLVITLATQDNAKLLEQWKSGFKRTIIWNKYQSKVSIERQNQYLNYLIDLSFQGVNRLFVLLFENNGNRTVHAEYFLSKLEIKDYNVMIDGQKVFDEPAK